MNEIVDNVLDCFRAFVVERFERYRLGKAFCPSGSCPGDQHCQNPYMKTEADVQVKFGGFLEQWLNERDAGLTVHAEMPIYPDPRARADLTIHRIAPDAVWSYREQILHSLDSVIEIKLANVRHPLFDFERGGIQKDLQLLESLPAGVKRYLLIVDEAERIEPECVRDFLTRATVAGVTVVSNNFALMGAYEAGLYSNK